MSRFAPVFALLLFARLAFDASAQAPTVTIPHEGPDVFARLLGAHAELQPIREASRNAIDAQRTVVVVFGKVQDAGPALGLAPDWLLRLQRAGANILIASAEPDEGALSPWNLAIDGQPIPALPGRGYRLHAECPSLDPVDGAHPLFAGLGNRLATKFPASLRLGPGCPLVALQRFPVGRPWLENAAGAGDAIIAKLWRQLPGGGAGEPANPLRPLARRLEGIGGPIFMAGSREDAPAEGRMLVLAGHGLFTNVMLLQHDNDNILFAFNALDWLREGGDGQKRTHALFIVDGKVVSKFDWSLPKARPKMPVPPAEMLDRLLRGLVDEKLADIDANPGQLQSIAQGMVLIGTLLLLLYGMKKLGAGQYQSDTVVPLLIGPRPAAALLPSALEQRQRELLSTNNVGEAAQALAREWFRTRCGIAPVRWYAELGAQPPELVLAGSFWQRRQLRRQLADLWRIAQADSPRPVSRSRLLKLAQTLAELGGALDAGRLEVRAGTVPRKP